MVDIHWTKADYIRSKVVKLVDNDKAFELNHHLDDLIEETRWEMTQAKKKTGNPAVVGLAGFSLSTALLQFQTLGWTAEKHGISPVVLLLGLVFGGFAQLIAGFLEFGTGNNFTFCVFSTYGAFWIAFVGIQIWSRFISPVEEQDMSLFLLVFSIYTFVMLIAAARQNLALFATFAFLLVGLLLLVVADFCSEYEKVNGHATKKAGGAFLLVAATIPLYIMAHLVYMDVFKYNVLPLGPPLNVLLKGSTNTHVKILEHP